MAASPVEETAAFLRARCARAPRAILVLGSGLGALADEIEDAVRLPFAEIPGFPRRAQELVGHAGTLVAGRLEGVEVAAMQGRFHLYEGWRPEDVALPVRALAALGARVLLVTNAAGGIRIGLQPGDLMLMADHINLMWSNPLAGAILPGEERFPDMSDPYDAGLRRAAEEVARELRIPLTQGVYAGLLGPSYETPAEVRMLARLGADAVGMSTVPEVLAARALGVRCLGISCITNLAAGLGGGRLTHDEVIEVGARARGRLVALVRGVLPRVAG
ncbi:MAG TPA: purine-nucleoside phosphorylase [Longimicrobiaceae bacterium]|nr:purine-nucleoside phosphorylase [Longimicrobiaceae bacterium]